MNMFSPVEKKASSVLSVLGSPFRIQLALALGKGEACVCHLEALLNRRQAYNSQHLMALREAGLLKTRREGKYIFYRLADPAIMELIRSAAKIAGMDVSGFQSADKTEKELQCECPHCSEEIALKNINFLYSQGENND